MYCNLYRLGFIFALVTALSVGCGEQARQPAASEDSTTATFDAENHEEQGNALAVDADRFLDELAPGEWEQICAWMVAIQGGPHTIACGDGVSITVDTVESCSDRNEFPHCSVGLLAACVSAQAEDLCGNAPESCHEFYACVSFSGEDS